MKLSKKRPRLLLLQTFQANRHNLPRAILLSGIVFVPVSIYRSLNTSPSQSLAYTFIMYLLNLIGFLLAFRVVGHETDLRKNINQFISTAALKLPQFFAVSLLQLLAGVPLFVGLFLLLTAASVGKSGWWLAILGVVATALAIILSIRLSLASILVAGRDLTSIAALRSSFSLTRKRFWLTIGLFTVYFFAAVLFSTAIFIAIGLIPKVAQSNLVGGLVGGLLLSVLVPVYAYYLSAIAEYYEEKSEA